MPTAQPAPRLFISYRRTDSAGHARALYRDLCRRFDASLIFFDRSAIEAGDVFPDRLRDGVSACQVLLALMAPGWLETKAADGTRRLDGEDDFVRQEIASALQLQKTVIPVLFDDAPMPETRQLPADMRALAGRDALTLRGKNLEYELQLEELVRLLAALPGMPPPYAAGQSVIVGGGLDFEVYRGTSFVPIRLRAPLRAAFTPLIEDRTRLFAGRRQATDQIMAFAGRDAGGYLVITAPPGFGKTALIANLVAATPEAFAYHFFAPVYGAETLDEKFFLQNVLQQMAVWHGQSAELPDAINELRALYQAFVDTPLAHNRVLVLDGLDEVSQWKLAPYLGRRLPPRLHIVATVRDVGQDWRADYGFPQDQLDTLPLNGLDRDEIRALFAGLGPAGRRIADDAALVDQVVMRSAYENKPGLGADPFYVRFLAEDVASAVIAPEDIPDQPQGLEAYLNRWWKQIVELAGDAPVRDLFGTLAAAVGPIARDDLEAISPSLRDDWAGDFFDQVLARVRRLVRQHEDGRFSLAHPRLRHYIADPRRIGAIKTYRQRMLDYCAQWQQHRSPYALACYVTHLAETGRLDETHTLFSGEWIAAHWSVLRTYGPLVADFDRSARQLLAAAAPDYARILAFALARQTGRELMLGFPTELYVAWTELGEVERTLACLAALGTARGDAIERLIPVAARLLDLHREAADDFDQRAAELLARAADQLPLPRMTSVQLDDLSDLVEQLPAARRLPEHTRLRLVRQAVEFADLADDPLLHAAGLGVIASALCASEPDVSTARELLERARTALAGIDFTPDRAFVVGCLLPALETLSPTEVQPTLEALLAEGAALIAHGSLGKNPCVRLLRRWSPSATLPADEATALLVRFAELYLDESADYVGVALSVIVPHLCRLGSTPRALALLDRCWEADALEGARVVVSTIDTLREFAPERLDPWLQKARELTDPAHHDMPINREMFTGQVVGALAAAGDWEAALALADSLGRADDLGDAMVALLRRARTSFEHDLPARDAHIDRILAAVDRLDDEDDSEVRAQVGSVAAQVLAAGSAPRARRELARATALCLAHMPAGDCDDLLRLQAAGCHEEGRSAELVPLLQRMKWCPSVSATVASVVLSDTTSPALQDILAHTLLDELARREGSSLYQDALRDAASLVPPLARDAALLADALETYVMQHLETLRLDEQVRILASLAAGACHADPERGGFRFGQILDGIAALQAAGQEIDASILVDLLFQLASAAGPLGARLTPLAQQAEALASGIDYDAEDELRVRGALCLLAAQGNCPAANAALAALVAEIAGLEAVSPGALYIKRMFADLTGGRVGVNEAQANAAGALAGVLARYAHTCPAEATAVIGQLVDQAVAIQSEDDRGQALIDIFGKLGEGPAEWASSLESVLSGALNRLQLDDLKLEESVFEAAVETLCAADAADAAERIARQAGTPELEESLLALVAAERERLDLGQLSFFEQAFTKLDKRNKLAHAVLHSVKVENDCENVLGVLAESLLSETAAMDRERLLTAYLPMFAAPLRALHGTPEIGRLVDEVEALDRAFLEAARIVGQGESG